MTRLQITIGLTVLLVVSTLALYLNRAALVEMALERSVRDTLAARTPDEDRFAILFCGTGSPQHQADRSQSCLAIVAGDRLFLFDAGPGSAQQLREAAAPITRLDAVFLTHLHSDHVSGLGDVMQTSWVYGRTRGVDVIGPPGTDAIIAGFGLVFAHDLEERRQKAGLDGLSDSEILGRARPVTLSSSGAVAVYDRDGVTISAFPVVHPAWDHAYGYTLEYRGTRIVISGDTARSETLIAQARNADILIHEALNPELYWQVADAIDRLGGDIDRARLEQVEAAHTTTLDLARIAGAAEVERLYMTHLIPPIPANAIAEEAFARGMRAHYSGPIHIARDGQWVEIQD